MADILNFIGLCHLCRGTGVLAVEGQPKGQSRATVTKIGTRKFRERPRCNQSRCRTAKILFNALQLSSIIYKHGCKKTYVVNIKDNKWESNYRLTVSNYKLRKSQIQIISASSYWFESRC